MPQSRPKRSQEEIFASYQWWDQSCVLNQITEERCDYIEGAVNALFGAGALSQQDVLEVGCGGGLVCEALVRRGATVIGIDPSQGALEAARAHLRQSGLAEHACFEQGYAEALPYADGSFSMIVCLDVLEHVQNLHVTIKEIARVLSPGGIFIFDTINRTLLARLALIWIGERFLQRRGLVPGLHDYQHFIKPSELRTELFNNGLQVCELTGFMPRLINGRLALGPGWFKGVSYVGYATRGR